jgi:phosphate transport system permease protein
MSLQSRKLKNKMATWVFYVGGIFVIVITILMLVFLSKEVFPLFYRAKIVDSWDYARAETLSESLVSVVSEQGTLLLTLDGDGSLFLNDAKTGEEKRTWQIPGPVQMVKYRDGYIVLISRGTLYVYNLNFVRDKDTGLEVDAELVQQERYTINQETFPALSRAVDTGNITSFAVKRRDDDGFGIALSTDDSVYYWYQTVGLNVFDEEIRVEDFMFDSYDDTIYDMTFYPDGNLVLIFENGKVKMVNTDLDTVAALDTSFESKEDDITVTAVGQLIGGRGIVLGTDAGEIFVVSSANVDGQGIMLFVIHKMKRMDSGIEGFTFSGRDRTFAAWDETGMVNIYYSTTEQLRLNFSSEVGSRVAFNTRGDLLLTYGGESARFVQIDNPHPDVTFIGLFGPVWYEGYESKKFSWQSTGGSNEFESKLSLIPLIFGTLKGAFYAMILAVPLALSGAIFMNQFLHPSFHRVIKPVIEIMAGLPSVIIGFLAGLWLAPILEEVLPGVVLGLILIPIVIVISSFVLDKFRFMKNIDSYKYEIFILIPIIIAIFWGAVQLSPVLNNVFFAGDFRQFFFDTLGVRYDQRNAIVVGFAMGFAVIPLIFSLAEDALSFVPKEMIAGSLALGLSRWQTATGVAIKAATPGILSAIMIGFGRAVGETMIVLMATGNTPVLSMNAFNGFRTLSANIAVELPEAPLGSSVYRILFLTALLLFVFTFMINMLTDMIRKRMMKRFKSQ